MTNLTPLQLNMLLVGLVGLVVGWIIASLLGARNRRRLAAEARAEIETIRSRAESESVRADRFEEELRKARDSLVSHEQHAREYRDKSRAVAANLKNSELRVGELEAQVQASEEQFMRVQRELAKQKLYKAHEIQQLQQQLRDSRDHVTGSGQGQGVAPLNFPEPDITFPSQTKQEPKPVADPPLLNKRPVADPAPEPYTGRTGASQPVRHATATGSIPTGSGAADSSSKSETVKRTVVGLATDTELPDITDAILDTDEDVFEMTSEFDFDPEELLADIDD